MKTKSLNFRLIGYFAMVISLISLIIFFLLIKAFNSYYYDDIYRTLEENRNVFDDTNINDFIKNKDQDIREIEEVVWLEKGEGVLKRKFYDNISFITEEIFLEVEENIKKQKEDSKRYSMNVDDRKLFYVITRYKDSFGGKIGKGYNYYIVTFKWKAKDDTLEKRLFIQIAILFILGVIMMFLVAFYVSKNVIKPLVQLEKDVKNIANRNLDIPIEMNRDDEIGFLANSIEKMRKELLKYDEDQKFKLHSISHELKTPVMIIKSYLEAVKKGLYPKGTLDNSLEVMVEECNRLEKLVYNLLYIQRLDYLDSEIKNRKKVNLKEILQEVIKSYLLQLKQLDIQLDIDDVVIYSDYKQLKVIVENILDNQIRYAKTLIKISLTEDKEKVYLNFFNDGECIEKKEDIFKLFKKGKKGQSGIGLYIVKRLLEIYDGKIDTRNVEDGVWFEIEIEKY